jgi:ATP-dependent DNA helicase RecG
MLVEDAERYGISQLHQLRGRIGRGEHESLCLLFGPKESPRLQALAEHRDGFRLAEIDLELRGEGEMLGIRQSGLAAVPVARLPEDAELLERARMRAARCSTPTRRSSRPSTSLLADAVARLRRDALEPDPRVRVIAGRFGGRRLRRRAGRRPGPTSDRVREALFSMLGDP